MPVYTSLEIDNPDELLFGRAPKPLTTRSGMVLGGGMVYPELNFTLPPMTITESVYGEIYDHYRQIVSGALKRAVELQSDGVMLEFETLPPMTMDPELAVNITEILLEGMEQAAAAHGMKSALRVTPNDNREMVRPPAMRSGHYWDRMLETFEGCAGIGGELLSIESVGGKELHDEALTMCDIGQVIFSLCILGCRDMRFLWDHIVAIAHRHGVHAAGDTACGFGNTAMVLAEQKLIPRVFAAVVRPVTAVRSLVAYECGAVGPGKDCGYENPYLKAITGFPMSLEGKTSACAHLSPLGNIAAASCDAWSNESVQNIKLLGGMAPTCYMEQLIYDCRLMNQASASGESGARVMRDWLVASDAALDPQAYVLTPENVITLSRVIVDANSSYEAGVQVARATVDLLRKGHAEGAVSIPARELPYLDLIDNGLDELDENEEDFIADMLEEVDCDKFVPVDYELTNY